MEHPQTMLKHSVSANVHVHYFHSSSSAELSQCLFRIPYHCLLTLLDPCYVSGAGGQSMAGVGWPLSRPLPLATWNARLMHYMYKLL